MSKSFSSAVLAVGSVLLWLFMGQLYVSAQFLPADASMKVTRVDQNLNPISGTQVQIFGVERDASGVIGIRRIYSPLYSTNPTVFTTDLQTIFNELYALGKPYTGLSLSVTDLPYHNEYLGSCVGENCIPTFSPYRMTLTSRGFCNGTVCTEAEHLGFGGNWFIKYVPGPDVCPAGKHPFPDVTSVPCVLRSTMKLGGGTELKLESTPNIIGSCSLKTTYQQNGSSYTVTPASGSALSVSSPGMSILANVTANIPVGQDSLPNILNCPTDYVAMCSISDTGSNLCGCYFPHLPGETWAPIKPSNYTCVDDVVSTCGNPRAQVNFVPYTGIPPADQNSSTNAWDSITLGNKAVVPGGTFFDITDGANPIDDGTIVSTGLQNFAVSRHNGYIEFLALGRRLPAYYGYYQGTIKFENVQVDRVESGLTTATWADIGLEPIENDTATKVSDTEVSFKLAFANQGDSFRVYLKNPTPIPCACPAGQEKAPDPKSPVCIVRALVKGVQDTEFILTGYNHLTGNCTLAAGTPQAPQTSSTEITVTAGQQRTSWMQGSPWTFQLDPLLTCPAGTTKTACMFTYGAGPLGEITCGCYPDANTNTPKNLSCQTFTNPIVHGKPVHSRSGSPEQFCREQGYDRSATVGATNEYNFIGNLSKWNGSVWEINPDGMVIRSVSCCTLKDQASDICRQITCPAGQAWDVAQNKCVVVDQCTPIVTLKKGSDLTTVTNPSGEAFSTNGACANKNISLSPCHFTNGAIPDGTSPSGNPLYRWPKEASGLSRDYNLVEIKGQCWFADNLQENSSVWPSPVDTWENTAPHNGYGLYSYAGTGVNRPEGYLYQFDAATNNPTPGGGPAGSLQGVCPAGWHVATDCEYQYVEHALGMTVAEQQAVGARTSGAVGTAMKSGGSSGFDMPLSGARRYNTGFINGGSEGHLWSTDCDTSAWPTGGCYKRILNVTNGNITRIKGDGGTYDSSHHAAGSVRCVKDGTETPTTCPVAKCAEGQYYCHTELKCKPANEACGTVTCNNNGTCDLNESCDCADCNEQVDHCGIDGLGQQLICTKDTAEKCYTDKFPYCLSACLDGYTRNTNGQCVLDTSSFVAPTCTNRSIDGTTTAIATCQTNEVLTGGGCTNTMGGAYFLGGFPIKQGESWTTYTPTYDPGYWHSLEYPAAPVGPITATGNGFACATGYSATYVRATAVCCENTSVDATVIRNGTIGDSKSLAQCNAGEVRVGGGCRYISGGSYFVAGYPINAGETYSALTATQDGFVCVGGVGTMIEARAVCKPAKIGETVKVIKGPVNGVATCDDGYTVTGGGCESIGGAYYYIGNIIKAGETNAYTALTPTNDGYVCASGAGGTNSQPYAICVSPSKPSGTSGGSTATSCQNYTGNVQVSGGYLHVGQASTDQFCKEKGYTSSTLISQYTQSGSCRLWNGTSWYEDPACEAVSDVKCCNNSATSPGTIAYFGGMYSTKIGGGNYNNPLTSSASCPTGYTGYKVIGNTIGNQDGATFVCVRKQSDTTPAPTQYIDFGGMYGGGGPNPLSGIVRQVNPFTGAASCPVGYTTEQILGSGDITSITSTVATSYDYPLYYCWKPSATPPTSSFGGMGGTHDLGINYINPVTGTVSCPSGFSSIQPWGTDYVDHGFQWCYKGAVVNSPEPQLGACCPPGSAWNSVENRCVPTTCGEGQFYCAAQKKCLAGGTTCDTTVCNNDGVCSGEESCQCGDCVNGGGDDRDKCSVIGGVQAMCSDDNLTDNKPGACCIPPKKWNSTTNSCVECSNTQAPSELKAGVDEPYITCTGNGDTTKTHFRYRITKQGVTEAPFISDMYTVGTQVLHPTMTLGDYTVECFYGNATSVDASTTAAPHSCVKTMSVKSDAQGCSRVYPYKGSTLSDEMTSAFAFDASFRCGSRKPVVGTVTNPYMFRIGTQPISYLTFDSLISELFNGLTIGPVSTQTQNYDFNTGTTDVTCATKVGGGYSTNNACRLTACAGGNCNTPQTFSVVHSDDLTCTTENTSTYNIGCNPAAPDSVRNQCIQWFRDAVTAGSRNVLNGVEFDVSFVFNADAPTNVKCIKYVAGQMPGGLNLSDNVVCRATLNNGERYQIYAADTNGRIDALQTTAKTVERDREAPTMAEIKYYTDDTLTTEVPSTNWYNKPIVALAVCSDTPLNEATSCACAKTVDPTTTDAAFWSVGVPNSLIGADLMRYTRTITESTTGTQKVLVMDTAGNKSPEKNIAVSLDTQSPIVALVESGTGATKTVTLTATDLGSKIWKTTTAPTGATNTNGIIYRVGPKADIQTLAFDAECNTTSSFATVAETKVVGFPSQALATVSVNTATQVVAYCVRDNAGNTTRGIYPVITNACFSSSNMATIPKLDTYKDLLKTRLSGAGNDNQKYGYSFSENTTDANCFRGILANNVTTLMANQLKAKTSTTLSNWDTDRSQLSTSTTLSNGYYYYVYPTSNTLDIVTSPTGSGAPVKTVVVDGGDIRIKTDLIYSGEGKTLLIVARKNANGQGGNIIIDTNVKRIDAILIADGGALKSSDATLPGERLIINGRVYSYNTRGGSLSISGVDLIDAAIPKRFTNASLVNASSLNDARVQDLERFRPMFADGSNVCSLTVNYTAFTTTNLPALLKRPSTYTGGSCGF